MVVIALLQNLTQPQQGPMQRNFDIDWDAYMDMPFEEEAEFPIDHKLRLLREEEEKKRGGVKKKIDCTTRRNKESAKKIS